LTKIKKHGNVEETVERGLSMRGDIHGPFETAELALAKIDELAKKGIKAGLNNKILKGTDRYHSRLGFLTKATFKWFVTEGNKFTTGGNDA
jgi:hypothetical protein